MKIATHNGRFHADDVFALATLTLAGVAGEIVRTRDTAELESSDIRVDVGRKNNPATGDFDHHQLGGAGARPNGIPYASFGLVWKKYGEQVAGSIEVAKLVDHALVQVVDADDVGFDLFSPKLPGISPYDVSTIIGNFNLSWQADSTPDQVDQAFAKAVSFATIILKQEITKSQGKIAAQTIVRSAIQAANDPRIIIMDQFAPWKDTVIPEAPEALYVLFPTWPAVDGQWSVYAVNTSLNSFESRRRLPEPWAGKEGQELANITGVADAVFCHSAGFLAIAGSKEGALSLAKLAIA